jgi:hypothetical protein
MSCLINKSAVRDYALDVPSAKAKGFERVSADFLERIEALLKDLIKKEVIQHPSIGKTLK